MDEDTIKAIYEIKTARNNGMPWADILEKYWKQILLTILLLIALNKLKGPVGRFFGRLLRRLKARRLARKMLDPPKVDGDTVTVGLKDEFRNKGLTGIGWGGTIGNGRIDIHEGLNTWTIPTELRRSCLGAEIALAFIKQLIDLARRMGIKEIRIRRAAATDAGGAMLKKAGFKKVGVLGGLKGTWELRLTL